MIVSLSLEPLRLLVFHDLGLRGVRSQPMKSTYLACPPVLLVLVMSFTCGRVHGQSVFIPDTNMRNWLNSYGLGSVDADGWFDPMHPEIVEDTLFDLVFFETWDLTGIEALHNARQLNISGSVGGTCQATISDWPDSLRVLQIDVLNGIQHISGLPPTMTGLQLDGLGVLETIDAWPTQLIGLSLSGCPQLEAVPELPSGLRSLLLTGLGSVNSLPPFSGTQLEWLKIGITQLAVLPSIPNSVEWLWLTGLPSLSAWPQGGFLLDSLRELRIELVNVVGDLPPIPQHLEFLLLNVMPGLTGLPEFNDGLGSLALLNCAALSALPDRFPSSLRGVEITDCPLVTCLPWLHDSMDIYVEFSGIDCLPNIPANDLSVNPSYLLSRPCAIYGPYCTVPGITGETYIDSDGNGALDPGEPPYPYATIQLEPGGILCSSDSSGRFEMGPGPGDYQILPTTHPYVVGVVPPEHSASLATTSETDSLNNFGYTLVPGMQDLRVDFYRMSARSGFVRTAWLSVRNVGTVPVSATAVLNLDTLDQFVSSDVPPSSVDGQTFTWELGEIPPGMIRVIELSLIVPPGTPFNLPMLYEASVLPVDGDLTPTDNTIVATNVTINGLDPNDKRVSPEVLTPSEVLSTERLTYTINFQNTGNYQADRVVITDTLSEDLHSHTIEFLSSSHEVNWSLVNGVLVFNFDNIFLPDSTTDEQGSHGFVRFTMRPVADLQVGDQVSNVANIYFDFNEPVITAPAIVTVTELSGVSEQLSPIVKVFPDPAQESLFVQCDGVQGVTTWEICDISGKRALSGSLLGSLGRIDVSGLQAGAYMLRLASGGGLRSTRFLKR